MTFQRRLVYVAMIVVLGAPVVGCSPHGAGSMTPPDKRTASSVKTSSPPASVPNLFAQARNKKLKAKDLDAYISPSVVGRDRELARKFLAFMPANARGDFVYADPNGHVISNNADLLPAVKLTREKPQAFSTSPGVTPSAAGRRAKDYSNGCSPPNPYSGSGPYVRSVSQCGFAGGWGFVNLKCGTTQMNSDNDNGHMYMEVWGNGVSSEGGLFTHTGGSDINPYLRVSTAPGNGYVTMNNNYWRYACNQNLAVWHGVVNAQIGSWPVIFTEVGIADGYDPETVYLQSEVVSLTNASWLFYTAPSQMNHPGSVLNGTVPTPCTSCTISKVTSIAQNGGDNWDGSVFGIDEFGYDSVHWMQVLFGSWLSGCQEGASLCVLEISRDPNRYLGGQQYYPNSGASYSALSPTGYGPYESYDSILALSNLPSSTQRQPEGSFAAPLPPDCVADGSGYCVAWQGGPGITQQTCIDMWQNQNWETVGYDSYLVKTPEQVLVSYEHGYRDDGSGQCASQEYWSPDEPSHVYGDANLP